MSCWRRGSRERNRTFEGRSRIGPGRNRCAEGQTCSARVAASAGFENESKCKHGGAALCGKTNRLKQPSSFRWRDWISSIPGGQYNLDRKSTRLNSSHANISYAV